jgi:hypothetical protein
MLPLRCCTQPQVRHSKAEQQQLSSSSAEPFCAFRQQSVTSPNPLAATHCCTSMCSFVLFCLLSCVTTPVLLAALPLLPCFTAAAACYAPEAIFTGAPATAATALLKASWAPGFLLAGAACVVLCDAAGRGRLGASTFRRLNAGLAVLEGGYAATFAVAIRDGLAQADGAALGNLAASLAIAAFCGYQAAMAGQSGGSSTR